jgi:serine/threonine protein kinase
MKIVFADAAASASPLPRRPSRSEAGRNATADAFGVTVTRTDAAPVDSLGRPRAIGRYRIHDEIGVGGMGSVHLGWMIDASCVVAIKRLRADLAEDPDLVAMFCDEARVALRIVHRNVVRALDVVEADGQPFLVMELVRGASLSRLVRCAALRGESVPPAVAAGIVAGMLHGLHAVHEARDERGEALGVIHRDVSPQNVMVDTDGTSRILDFGVAKAAGRMRVTQAGQLKGKLQYMAPEQLGYSGSASRRSDIYAASAVLWETLCGRKLFREDPLVDASRTVTDTHSGPSRGTRVVPGRASRSVAGASGVHYVDALVRRYGQIPGPSTLVPGVPRGLDEVILRGLDPLPSNRFATAREMALAIEAAGPVASEEEIGAWVRSLDDPELEAREQLVTEIERSAGGVRVAGGDRDAEAPGRTYRPGTFRRRSRVSARRGAGAGKRQS